MTYSLNGLFIYNEISNSSDVKYFVEGIHI